MLCRVGVMDLAEFLAFADGFEIAFLFAFHVVCDGLSADRADTE